MIILQNKPNLHKLRSSCVRFTILRYITLRYVISLVFVPVKTAMEDWTRSQVVARIADRTAEQQFK